MRRPFSLFELEHIAPACPAASADLSRNPGVASVRTKDLGGSCRFFRSSGGRYIPLGSWRRSHAPTHSGPLAP